MRLDDVVKIYSPNTTSRSFMADTDGLKCIHYGDIYKNYSDREIDSSNIQNSISLEFPEHKVIKRNAIIVADVSETLDDWGHVTFIKYDGTPFINGTHTLAIVCDCATTLRYLFYYFRDETTRKRLRQFLTGVTVFQMSIKSLNKYKIDQPPLPTQTRIAEILSAYDDAIENNNRRIVLLEKAARELYREWFVRMRFPGHESAKFVNGLPEGWERKKLGVICNNNIFSGGTPTTTTADYWNGQFKWLSSGETRNRFIVDTEKTITQLGVNESSTRLANNGDIVMACAGQGNTRGQTSLLLCDMYINQSVIAIRSMFCAFVLYNLVGRYNELR
ncbi:MAG: restriction endonuclease subunit S, partial [Oscillospiraceae bacterium]|nr:restriction endonuclease subunit S [Oscillospiraceae bacterium]